MIWSAVVSEQLQLTTVMLQAVSPAAITAHKFARCRDMWQWKVTMKKKKLDCKQTLPLPRESYGRNCKLAPSHYVIYLHVPIHSN